MRDARRTASPCITAALRAASRRLTLLYDEIMAPSGLRVTQFNLLAELERQADDPPTVGELAGILTMERSALGQTLRPLERDGLIELGRDDRDGRRRPIGLTPAGEAALIRARPYWQEAHGRFVDFFGDDALTELRHTLRDIAEKPEVSRALERRSA